MHTLARFCESQRCFFSLLIPLKYYILFFVSSPFLLRVLCLPAAVCLLVCPLPSPPSPLLLLPAVIPIGRALEALWRPSVCSAVCRLAPAVTRPLSGAKRRGSVGRCTAYMSPALSPLAYVLPCVPLSVPWLPAVRPCVCPAALCRLVAIKVYTPQYPGRRRCGAASAM